MRRSRLTITLKNDLVKKLDAFIDGSRIRNRSHAIEYLLEQSFPSVMKKAVILCGGKGLRMRPFTYEMPKAMIPVHDKPVIEYTIELLKQYEVRDIILSIGYLGEKIKNYFGDGRKWGVKISYSDQGSKELGTAGSLKILQEQLGSDPFILFYGDVLIDINLRDLVDFHKEKKALVTMALTSVKDSSVWGVVKMHGNQIVEYLEKPGKGGELSHLINAGVYILEPQVIDNIPRGVSMLEQDVFPKLAKDKKMYGYLFEGQWFDIGTPEIYERVLKEWQK